MFISGSESRDQAALVLCFPDSSPAIRAPPWAPVHFGVGFRDGQWAVGELFGAECWNEAESGGHSPSAPITQSVSTLAYSPGCYTVTKARPTCKLQRSGLSSGTDKLPTRSGNRRC